MWKWSLLALGLGLLFAVLAWSGLRRRSSWRDGEKLWGQVAGVSVTPAWNGADSMDGDRSPRQGDFAAFPGGAGGLPAKGLPQSAGRPRPGPAGAGAVPPLHRGVGPVEGRPLLVGAVGDFRGNRCGGVSPAAVGRKNRGRPALRLHRRPPQPGRQRAGPARGLWGRGNGGGPCLGPVPACAAGRLPPPCLGCPLPVGPVGAAPSQNLWAGCRSPTGTAGVRSCPLFSLWGSATLPPAVTRQERFAPGASSPFTRAPSAGPSLEPEPLDYLLIPIALLPVFFLPGRSVLCLLVTKRGLSAGDSAPQGWQPPFDGAVVCL